MHILVDIRMTNPEDIVRQSYAFAWVELWKKYHPHDTITYLGFQDASAPGDMIRVSSRWSPFG